MNTAAHPAAYQIAYPVLSGFFFHLVSINLYRYRYRVKPNLI